jgi:putative copper resistance protein D
LAYRVGRQPSHRGQLHLHGVAIIRGIETALVLTRLVHFASTFGLFGIIAFGAYADGAARAVAPALRRNLIAAAFVALASAIAWVLLEAASFVDDWSAALDPETVGAVLADTDFGHVWSVRLGVAALVLGFAAAPGGRLRNLGFGLLAGVLAGTLGLSGHAAMETGWLGLFHRVNHTGHLLAIGVWLGGLWPLGLSLRLAPKLAALAVRRFSAVGVAIVLLILVSGCINSWFLIGSWHGLWHSDYGHVLIIKVLLVVAMVGLAAVNRLVLLARIEEPATLARLGRHVVAEQLLGLAILAAASVLGTLPPAGYGPAL